MDVLLKLSSEKLKNGFRVSIKHNFILNLRLHIKNECTCHKM
jgi:hypothetical protein